MTTTTKALIAAAFLAVIAMIIYSTMGLAKVSCEVCVEFNGRRSCRPAAGTTAEEAAATAQRTACADVAFGRDDSIACTELRPPVSVTCQ